MQPIRANELLAGLALAGPEPITAVVTDSREVRPGCVFVCFAGQRVDGHDYAAAAYRDGAAYIVANHAVEGVPAQRTVVVESSHRAMVRMAANYRMLFSPLMVGVTGSVGKTTTKEFCYAVLSAFGNTLKTLGNENNEIGLPKTLFRLEPTTEYAVVEMGMSNPGEIERLVRAARPSAGIITKIGVSHMENLGSRENILKAKLEICHGLPDGAPLVLNADDDLLPTAAVPARLRTVWFSAEGKDTADVYAVDVREAEAGTAFTLVDAKYGRLPVRIPTVGLHTVADALAAYAAATRLGLDPVRAAAALADFSAGGHRQRIEAHDGVTVIDDCYNASPDSMRAALGVLAARPGRRIAVLGDMLELGALEEAAHRQVGEWAAQSGVALLVACGPRSAAMAEAAAAQGTPTWHCQTAADVVGYLRQHLCPGDVLLFKASRGVGLEKAIEGLWPAHPAAQ